MPLSASFVADFSSFIDQTQDAVTAMQGFTRTAEELGPGVDRGLEETMQEIRAGRPADPPARPGHLCRGADLHRRLYRRAGRRPGPDDRARSAGPGDAGGDRRLCRAGDAVPEHDEIRRRGDHRRPADVDDDRQGRPRADGARADGRDQSGQRDEDRSGHGRQHGLEGGRRRRRESRQTEDRARRGLHRRHVDRRDAAGASTTSLGRPPRTSSTPTTGRWPT